MITTIRRSFQGKAYKVILWITILALTGILSLPELLKMGSSAAWIASINKEEVPYSDYGRKVVAYQHRLAAMRAQYGQAADIFLQSMGMSLDPKTLALEQLIQETLLNQAARDMSIVISNDYIAERLSNPVFVQQELADLIPYEAYDQSGGINMGIVKAHFRRLGLSMADFEQKVAQKLQRRMVLDLASVAGYAPEIAIKNQFSARYLPKKFSILTIPLDKVIKKEKSVSIPEQELQAYYDAQKASKRYMMPEKREGIVWRIEPQNYGITITDNEIERYYQDNKAKYVDKPAQVQVRHILFKVVNEAERAATFERAKKTHEELVKNPTQFAQTASAVSDDKGIERGGLLPYFARGNKELSFDKAAFTLKADGDISDVIETKDGFEILQRVDKKQAMNKPLENVKQEINQGLLAQKFADVFVSDIRSINEQAKGDIAKVGQLLKAKGAKSQALSAVSREDETWGKELFGLRHKGDSDGYVANGVGVAVQLTNINQAHMPEFNVLKATIENDLHQQRSEKLMHDILQKAEQGVVDLNELQAAHGGSIETTGFVAQNDEGAVAKLQKKNIPISLLFQIEKTGSVKTGYIGGIGFVARLDEAQSFNQEQFDSKKTEVAKELEREQSRLFIDGFVASLYRNAKISINDSQAPINEEYYQYEE